MKKITLSLLAVFAFAGSAFAQTPDVKFGAKGGLNVANLTSVDDAKSRASFHIGALAEIFINEKFSIQPEILYSAQGAKTSYTDSDMGINFKVKSTMKLDYINVPVIAKYYVTDAITVHAGPQIGFNVKSEEKLTVNGNSETFDYKDSTTSVDFALGFGAGYQLPMGVFFDLRYNVGMSNIAKDSDGSAKNNVLQVSVGYKF